MVTNYRQKAKEMIERQSFERGNMKKRFITSIIFMFLLSSLFAYDWSGRYLWVNSTKKDNGGKMKSVEMVVKETEDEWKREIYLVDDGEEFRLFPLVLPTDESFSAWHKYKEDSVEAETFRHNNKKINTSSFNPGKWMIEEIKSSDSESVTLVKVGAFNIKVGVTITFSFSLDEKGKEQLTFWMDTDLAMADGMFFKNPEHDSGGRFVLKKQ